MTELEKATNKLNRCLHLLNAYNRKSVYGQEHALVIRLGMHDGLELTSYDFDNELSDYLLPFLKLRLDQREKELRQEIKALL